MSWLLQTQEALYKMQGGTKQYLGKCSYTHGQPFSIPIDWFKTDPPGQAVVDFDCFEPRPYTINTQGPSDDKGDPTTLIKLYEGLHLTAYPDPLTGADPITIGWGSTRDLHGRPFELGTTITENEAKQLLDVQLIREFIPQLKKIPHWHEMKPGQRSALISFAYNLGAHFYDPNGSDFRTISVCLRDKDWDNVPAALMLYRNPGTDVELGLGRRRYAECLVWVGEDPQNAFNTATALESVADVRAIAEVLSQEKKDHPAPSESVRDSFDPNKPIDWSNPNCKVSKYFTVAEVTQNDSRRIPTQQADIDDILRLAKELDRVREAWGSPIGVTSWFRPEPINRQVGGVQGSQHTYGRAADIYTMDSDGFSQRDREFENWLDQKAWSNMALGYGVSAGRGFTHIDTRAGRIRWNY